MGVVPRGLLDDYTQGKYLMQIVRKDSSCWILEARD